MVINTTVDKPITDLDHIYFNFISDIPYFYLIENYNLFKNFVYEIYPIKNTATNYNSLCVLKYQNNYDYFVHFNEIFDKVLLETKNYSIFLTPVVINNTDYYLNLLNNVQASNNWHYIRSILQYNLIRSLYMTKDMILNKQYIYKLNFSEDMLLKNLDVIGIEFLSSLDIPNNYKGQFFKDIREIGNSILFDFDRKVTKLVASYLFENLDNLINQCPGLKYLHINIFPRNFLAKNINIISNLLAYVIDFIERKKSNLKLVLEFVEYETINNQIIKEVSNLRKDLDFLIALDDFGNGFFNYNIINDLKPDIIKIDKHLVQSLTLDHNNLYLKSLFNHFCQLAQSTKAKLIFEGIENQEMMDNLLLINKNYNIDTYFQGYYYHYPEKIFQKYIK
ncbi:hypothetical protein DEFDS_P209 (plasmid) [Deferribacter desulfuricans SSM1]|uniref:EAL domain-containing protein n=1 Tax=Deferribacter desulfuricans (strain DSM 14783 / JCM 11476 / NBRC 101012 / SSM1) TaxID=639282 RepID=D3PF37_DEFDS|nr:EAL domain-containing protein [Deferribacter desulfuricans]BAI81829.1 hypothetical protein DEFDS_P209 [Deferribacter desulfuricans SSM1]